MTPKGTYGRGGSPSHAPKSYTPEELKEMNTIRRVLVFGVLPGEELSAQTPLIRHGDLPGRRK